MANAQRFGVYYTAEMIQQEKAIRERLAAEGIKLNRSELVRYLLNKFSGDIHKQPQSGS